MWEASLLWHFSTASWMLSLMGCGSSMLWTSPSNWMMAADVQCLAAWILSTNVLAMVLTTMLPGRILASSPRWRSSETKSEMFHTWDMAARVVLKGNWGQMKHVPATVAARMPRKEHRQTTAELHGHLLNFHDESWQHV